MKVTTLLIAFGPAALLLGTKAAIEPDWLREVSLAACVGIGVAIGLLGGIAARIVEPRE